LTESTVEVAENLTVQGPSIEIPRVITHEGSTYRVIAVGFAAFHLNGHRSENNHSPIRKLTFAPDSEVLSFDEAAIEDSEILELQIPPKLVTLHERTFRHTAALVRVTADGNPHFVVHEGALYDSSRTKLLFVPRKARVAQFDVPASVTVIGAYAFAGCAGIRAIRFSGRVACFEAGAFAGSGLTTLTIPASVATLGDELAAGCANLVKVTFEGGSALRVIPPLAFSETDLMEIVIPKSVVEIQEKAFADTPSLARLDFECGSECTAIAADALSSSGLRELFLPPKLIDFPPNFFNCRQLRSLKCQRSASAAFVEWGEALVDASVSRLYFVGRDFRGRYAVPNSVVIICGSAFCDCVNLSAVHFGPSSQLARIEALAFFGTGLTAIDIPASVTEISDSAFGECLKLRTVTFRPQSQLQAIGAEAFRHSGLEVFAGPDFLEELGRGVFGDCLRLKSVLLPSGVLELREDTFTGCRALEEVRSDAPSDATFTVHAPAFPENFSRDSFRHRPGVTVVDVTPEWPADIAECDFGPPDDPDVYERKLPPGTPTNAFVVDDGERVRIGEVLSHTPIACTYLARHVLTGEISLVKEFSGIAEQQLDTQLPILPRVVHAAILGVIGVVLPGPARRPKLITEFMPRGSLEALVRDTARHSAMTATAKVKIAVGLVLGMRYIHECQVLHRDLKPSNVLLDANDEVRIGNFGLATFVDFADQAMDTGFEPHFYMAPDMYEDSYGKEVDVFSFAMILWELLMGKRIEEIVPGAQNASVLVWPRKIGAGWRPPVDGLTPFAGAVLRSCWAAEPTERVSFTRLIENLKTNNYALLPGVIVEEIAAYVERIEEYEREYPAASLGEWLSPEDD
jgi:hypothetical protein